MQPRSKATSFLAAKTLFAATLSLFVVACGGGDTSSNGNGGQQQPPAGSYLVTYSVSGSTKSASLTYANSQGGTAQETVSVPWSKQYTFKKGDFLYISAQNEQDTGSVTTDIRVNGVLTKTATSSGAYVIATASGTCC